MSLNVLYVFEVQSDAVLILITIIGIAVGALLVFAAMSDLHLIFCIASIILAVVVCLIISGTIESKQAYAIAKIETFSEYEKLRKEYNIRYPVGENEFLIELSAEQAKKFPVVKTWPTLTIFPE